MATFSRELGPDDRLFMLEVFYVIGTATRDFSSADIVAEIAALGTNAEFALDTASNAVRMGLLAFPILIAQALAPFLGALLLGAYGTSATHDPALSGPADHGVGQLAEGAFFGLT